MTKDKNFIAILPFMVQDLKLTGNELIVYAIIYGFSQDGESSFHGSLSYLSRQTGITKRSIITILKKLVSNNLISKEEVFFKGSKFAKYAVCINFTRGEETSPSGEKVSLGGEKTSPLGGEETSPNNKDIYNKDNNINYQNIVDFFNENCPSLPKVAKLSDKRRKAIKAVIGEYGEQEVKDALLKVEVSPFLSGKDNKWRASFDWLMNKNNLLKVIEGNYDHKKKLKEGDKGYYANDIPW